MDLNELQREYFKESMKDPEADATGQTVQEREPLTAKAILKQLGKEA